MTTGAANGGADGATTTGTAGGAVPAGSAGGVVPIGTGSIPRVSLLGAGSPAKPSGTTPTRCAAMQERNRRKGPANEKSCPPRLARKLGTRTLPRLCVYNHNATPIRKLPI
eukprot:gene12025-biopygen3889